MAENGARRIRLGMVGGGTGAFIGYVHRIAARLDGDYELVAGALSSRPEVAKESGKNVYLLTQGGGNRMVCDGLANGTYSESVVYFVPGQARDMANMIKFLLQQKQPAGATKTTLFTKLDFLTKDNMTASSCWDMPPKS